MPRYSNTYIHLAISQIKNQSQFDAQRGDLERAINEQPNLLITKNLDGDNPLWYAVKQKTPLMVEYLLQKFADKYSILGAKDPTIFRTMFMQPNANASFSSLYDYVNDSLEPSQLILELLKNYGADLYSPKPLLALNRLFTEGRLDNPAYWTAFSRERVKQQLAVHKTQKLACQDYLNLANPMQNNEQHDKQLIDLADYLQSESREFVYLLAADSHSLMNARVRPAIRAAAAADIASIDERTLKTVETLFFMVCLTGFVFWAMYNHTVHMRRNGKARDLKNFTNYEDCIQYEINPQYDYRASYNDTFVGADQCLVPAHRFSEECKSDEPFWNAYQDCYRDSLIYVFQTLAMIFVGLIMVGTPPQGLSPRLFLAQELVKAPVYFARYMVGEQGALYSVPSKWSRMAVYKELILILQTVFTEGEGFRALQAQLDILNKPSRQITALALQAVVGEIIKYFNEYGQERVEGFATIDPAKLAPVLNRLLNIVKSNTVDVEAGNSVDMRTSFSPGLKKQPNEKSKLIN